MRWVCETKCVLTRTLDQIDACMATQMPQGEIERRYTCVLFHVVRCVSRPAETSLHALLDAADDHARKGPGAPAPSTTFLLQPLVGHFEAVFGAAVPRLDPRVLRRLAREVWNKAAGQLHDALTGELGDAKPSGSIYNSVDNLLPRIWCAESTLFAMFSHILSQGGGWRTAVFERILLHARPCGAGGRGAARACEAAGKFAGVFPARRLFRFTQVVGRVGRGLTLE